MSVDRCGGEVDSHHVAKDVRCEGREDRASPDKEVRCEPSEQSSVGQLEDCAETHVSRSVELRAGKGDVLQPRIAFFPDSLVDPPERYTPIA